MQADYGICVPFGHGGHDEMGKRLQNTFETPKKTCAMTPLLSSTPVVKHVSMSVTANRHGDEKAMEKAKKEQKEKEEKKDEENDKKEASTSDTSAATGAASDVEDLEATRQAVLIMGMPEALVQLVIDLRHVEPTLSFTNARELYQLVDDLVCQPDRQAELTSKLSQHQQQASWNTSSNVAAGQEPGALSPTTTTTSDLRQNQPAGMSEGSPHQPAATVDSSSNPFSSFTAAENLPSVAGCSSQANPGSTSTDLSKTPASSSTKERLRKLAEENYHLNLRKRCRACRKTELADSGVTFLPCGHFITCEPCSEKFDDCPACGKAIMATVKTFLS